MALNILMLIILKISLVLSYPQYQTQIPNGQRVPNTCSNGTTWQGVGHINPNGAGPRNVFGTDFGLNNHNWTAVCILDSDGDGRTNGQELGDPQCTWKVGDTDPEVTTLTHPGICEPICGTTCIRMNAWVQCPDVISCPATDQGNAINTTPRLPDPFSSTTLIPGPVVDQSSSTTVGIVVNQASSCNVPVFNSLPTSVSAQVNFINRANFTVVIYWHNFQGQLVKYYQLVDGDHYIQTTYVSHIWSFQAINSSTVLVTLEGDPIYFPRGTEVTEDVLIVREDALVFKSLASSVGVNVTFVNQANCSVSIYSHDDQGYRALYGNLDNGGELLVRTFVNHAWSFRGSDDDRMLLTVGGHSVFKSTGIDGERVDIVGGI